MKISTKAIILSVTSALCSVNAFVPELSRTEFSLLTTTSLSAANIEVNPTERSADEKVSHHASSRKKWGVDKDHPEEYWNNNQIHTLGNTGFLGAVHAAMAPIATTIIDKVAYDGVDIRRQVAKELASTIKKNKARVLDLCCGVGMSTRALQDAFPNAEIVLGVDTSPEMISMANFITRFHGSMESHYQTIRRLLPSSKLNAQHDANKDALSHLRFANSNAESTEFPGHSFHLVTVMYAFHEAPRQGRDRILREARRLLRTGGTLALVDIAADYKPSEHMLAGEPYVLEYQENIHRQMQSVEGFTKAVYKTIVPGHVGMWLLKAIPSSPM